MVCVLDIETDSLTPTKIHVCVVKKGDLITHFTEENKEAFNTFIRQQKGPIVGHNALSFDIPALNKLWKSNIPLGMIKDTLVLSYLITPQIEGGHSLSAWGERFNHSKLSFDDFSSFSEEMLEYCKQDCRITDRLYSYLLNKAKELKFSEESINLEHDIRRIVDKQEAKGFYLDLKKSHMLLCKVKTLADNIEEEVLKENPLTVKRIKDVQIKKKKDGTLSKVGLSYIPNSLEIVEGNFSVVSFEPFNLGSPKQIIEKMEKYGWKPIEFTPKGNPKVTEDNLATVSSDAPRALQKLSEWKMLTTRANTIEQWLDALGSDGRVHGSVMTNGAITSRMTHASPNMANVVSVEKPYGVECRECWSVEDKNHVLVGMDANGLELRMLAHYMDDPEFTSAVIDGDPHSLNQQMAGLQTRAQAKTFIYAFLYGAGDGKIGSIIGGRSRAGRDLKRRFLNNMPKLNTLIQKVSSSAERGHIKALDGRRLFIRHSHAALNTLLQGAGAIVCKKWSVFLDEEIQKQGLRAWLVNTIHDELQFECHRDDAEKLISISDLTIGNVGVYYKMNVPLNADAKQGSSWADTH